MRRISNDIAAGFVVLVAAVLAGKIVGGAQGSQPPLTRVEPLPSPAADNSAGPQLTVEGDRAILSWLEVAGDRATLKFAERTPTGWSEARNVVSSTGLMVNTSDVPSVRALADGTIAAHWMIKNGPNPEVYNLRVAFSKDRGRTWSKPVSPHHDGTKTQHGFAALFQAPDAGLGIVWLDGRRTNPEAEEAKDAGNMSLRATVYGHDGKQRSEMPVSSRVCDCCPTDVAVTSEGPIVAFRNRSAQEVRDIYVSRLSGGRWTPPTAVHDDGWKIVACPVNGPAIDARGRDVAVAWFTAKDSDGRAFIAFSHDAGRTFGEPVRIDEATTAGRVDVALLPNGSAAVSWVEYTPERSQFKVRVVGANRSASAALAVADVPSGRSPRIAKAGDELLLAWTETTGGIPRVRTGRAPIPQ